jgi:hypothetical protein
MRDDRPIDAWEIDESAVADNELDEYVEQYLEYLDGTRPTAPSPDHLTEEERAEARDLVRLFKLNWGVERSPVPTTEKTAVQRSAGPCDVLIWHHPADRGWANWITLELENAGLHCWSALCDRTGHTIRAAEDTRIIAVVSSVLTTWYAGVEPGTSFPRLDNDCQDRLLAVRVEDCQAPNLVNELAPTYWLDLVGYDEMAARQALLERVADRRSRQGDLGQLRRPFQYLTAVHVLLNKVLVRLGRCTGRTTDCALDNDECSSVPAQAALAHAVARRGEPLPPLLRATLRNRLSCDTKRWLELADELSSLGRVKIALGSVDQAHEVFQQADGIRELFDEQEQAPAVTVLRRHDHQVAAQSARRELLPWPIS